jgi:outer membrane murein-binding lipoprotein Lpp
MKRLPRIVEICRSESGWLRVSAVVLAAGVLLAGCVSTSAVFPPAPDLQLLEAGALEIPSDCEPARGTVYRTAFLVQPDGRVDAVASESGSGCVQEALRQWVATFRYRPVAEPTAAVLDWMGVSAARGG